MIAALTQTMKLDRHSLVNVRVAPFVRVPLTGQSFLIFGLWRVDRVQKRLWKDAGPGVVIGGGRFRPEAGDDTSPADGEWRPGRAGCRADRSWLTKDWRQEVRECGEAVPLGSYHVLPTTTWMDPPSTGDLRRWGAPLNNGYAQIAERRIPALRRVSLESRDPEIGMP